MSVDAKTKFVCFRYDRRAYTRYLSHGASRPGPHLLRLLKFGTQISGSLGRFGVRCSHLHQQSE